MSEFLAHHSKLFSCAGRETDYSGKPEIRELFREGMDPERLLLASEFIREHKGSALLQLPPLRTLEAEAFGAKAKHDALGRRIKEEGSFTLTELERMPLPGREDPVWGPVLESIPLALTAGRKENRLVQFGASGAFSLAMTLLGAKGLMKAAVKEKERLHGLLQRLNELCLSNILFALKEGVPLIFFADASADEGVLGRERYRELVLSYEAKLLDRLEKLPGEHLVYLCGKTTGGLIRYGYLSPAPGPKAGKANKAQLWEWIRDPDIRFAGGGCLVQDRPEYGLPLLKGTGKTAEIPWKKAVSF